MSKKSVLQKALATRIENPDGTFSSVEELLVNECLTRTLDKPDARSLAIILKAAYGEVSRTHVVKESSYQDIEYSEAQLEFMRTLEEQEKQDLLENDDN
jgi:hypothetical protein